MISSVKPPRLDKDIGQGNPVMVFEACPVGFSGVT